MDYEINKLHPNIYIHAGSHTDTDTRTHPHTHLKLILCMHVCVCSFTITVFSARWQSSDWSLCSASCGPGQQTRLVTCVARISATLNMSMPDENCQGLTKPEARRVCRTTPCFAWRTGNWSRVGSVLLAASCLGNASLIYVLGISAWFGLWYRT